MHRHGDEVRIYTRNLNDITDRLPGVVAVARALPAEAVVLDGEVLGVDEDAKPRAFQDTMSAFGRDDARRCGRRPARRASSTSCTLDGVDLIDEPLTARQRRLDDARRATWPSLGCTPTMPQAASAALDVALADRATRA